MRVPCVQLAPQQPPRSIWKQFIRRRGRHFSLFAAPSFVCRWGRPETARSTRKKKIPAQNFAAGRNFLCEDALQDAIISAVQQRQAQVNEQKIYRSAYFGGG